MTSLRCKEMLCLLYSSLLFVSGIFLIGFSIVLCYKLFYHFKFVPTDALGPFLLMIFIGFVHLFLTWLGVKGPTREHDFHIIMFIAITAVLFFMEFCSGIWATVLWFNAEYRTTYIMQESLTGYIKNDFDKNEWLVLEYKLHCCGLNGRSDYELKEKGKGSANGYACCYRDFPVNGSCDEIYETGCKKPLVQQVESLMLQIALTGFFSGVFQIVGIVAFYTFYKNLKSERLKRSTLRRSRMNSMVRHGSTPTPMGSPATIS